MEGDFKSATDKALRDVDSITPDATILEEFERAAGNYYSEDDYGGRHAFASGYFKALAERLYTEGVYQAHEIASLRSEIEELKKELV